MKRWWQVLSRFALCRRGSATVFMMALLPMFMGLAGLAIDAAMVYRTRAQLQATADAAALAGALHLTSSATMSDITSAAISYAQLNLPVAGNGNVLATADIVTGVWDSTTGTFTPNTNLAQANAVRVVTRRAAVNGNAMPTTFLRLIGLDHWDVAASAISTSEHPKMWIGMALDNTGSMAESDTKCTAKHPPDPSTCTKIYALKQAAISLIEILKAADVHAGDIEMAIVPFARDVNVGVTDDQGNSNLTKPWIKFANSGAGDTTIVWDTAATPVPSSSVHAGSNCPWSTNGNGFQCQTNRNNGSSQTNTIPNNDTTVATDTITGPICPTGTSTGHYYNGCYDSIKTTQNGKTVYTHAWHLNNHNTWGGCVTDRDQNYDTNVVSATTTNPLTLFPADNSPSCPAAKIRALNDDWANMETYVATMASTGSTNQTIGFVWAWLALQVGGPLLTPTPPTRLKRIIIILSDGYNTQNRWTGDGSAHSTTIDARTKLACDNAKAQGIEIYSVFDDLYGTNGISDTLLYCASGTDHYFDLTSVGATVSTFEAIGKRITALRVVK